MKIAEKQKLETNTQAIADLKDRVAKLEEMMTGGAKTAKPQYAGDIEPSKSADVEETVDEKPEPEKKKATKKTTKKKK